ncbi:MAG: TetR/AcrR family transcriptional regulator [Chloroflexi bacterium]|nr:MAG: TetR/AcrR family transcriptional regulator [Chloroflexota bacterium]MBL1194543.1 TetR/AcrR family transcriptional regulator [Chloroflexota bacterium]NOH11831.1 TetR/AcrR family transcriptional regulator [Chloroflexota bacterium]
MPKVIDEDKLFLDVIHTLVRLGINKATTKQLAEAAGVNEVTLFRKYGNKASLIRSAFQSILVSSPMNDLSYSGDLEADLVEIVAAYKETSLLYGEVIPLLISEIPRDPELKELLEPFFSVVRSIMEIIQRYQGDGLLIDEPGFSAVSALLGPIIVGKMLQRTNPYLPVSEVEPEMYVAAFLEGRKK